MKKFKTLALVLGLTLSMSTIAFADNTVTVTPSEAKTFKFEKVYETTKGNTPATYPAETLKFSVGADDDNPDTTTITVADTTIDGNPDDIVITIPSYDTVGVYNYTITEIQGSTQGVTYATTTLDVQVLASYNDDHTAIVTETAFTTSDENSGKVEEIVNIYDLGSLDVTKEVTGNLGDQTKEFEVEVTFTVESGKTVKSNITYVDGTDEKTITVDALSDGTETVTITVKHGETVAFTNIPEGVTYTVKEKNYTEGDVNSDNGYDNPKYNGNEKDSETDSIEADTTDTVKITNNKGTEVATGIIVNNLPYIVTLVLIAGVVVLFVINKRRHEEF